MRQVVRQIKERSKIEIELNNIKYQFWRLDDYEYAKLRKNSIPIKEDYTLYKQLYSPYRRDKDKLSLGKSFVILTWLLGESSDYYDDWKGSFYFPLLLVIKKERGDLFYLLKIYDHRGSLDFGLYKISDNELKDHKNDILHDPFDSEFSRQEINSFWSYFYGYMLGLSQSMKLFICPLPFMKMIDSNHIIYGFKDCQFFEEQYNTESEYHAAIQSYKSSIDISTWNSQKMNLMLQDITSNVTEN
ncbi:hypothetical protein H6H03_39860 [Nostoc paludosum FACHB-159]|uniref:Uncharacterized protein n=1 Tax=Nostoc paludosum FACHB-159 TaxID=2692908 RepID=A0ABR8KQY6_9NOSO|nr:hypothetical protein [Nostoc paludosum]MBD2739917.1 hypothetical protein [Nostoc paludosum FACHB-159]